MCTSVSCRFQCLKSSLTYLRENGQLKFSSSLYLNDIITSVTSKHNAFQNISHNEYLQKNHSCDVLSMDATIEAVSGRISYRTASRSHSEKCNITQKSQNFPSIFLIIFCFQDSVSSNLVNNCKQHLSIERTRKKLPSVIWLNRIYTK